jgi:hypothetical protein
MTATQLPTSRILLALRSEARRQGTNPYQIAKASGMALTTVQRLLTRKDSLPLRNVERLIDSLGLVIHLVADTRSHARSR